MEETKLLRPITGWPSKESEIIYFENRKARKK